MWRKLAKQGDPAAQYALGWMYESGQGVLIDIKQAANWYKKSAIQNNVAAQYVLASIYDNSTEAIANPESAVVWYLKAANQGHVDSQFQLGLHYQDGNGALQNDLQSFLWFSKAAAQRHLSAQLHLGKIYQSGKGVKQDYQAAIKWYKEASSQGSANATFYLAQLYELGRGVVQDNQRAHSLYLASAAKHFAPAAYKSGEFYENGKAGKIDLKEAIKWYESAANKGDSAAQYKLAKLYQGGSGVEQNIRLAINWYKQAAIKNHPQAYHHLGLIYENGEQGINVDKSKAFDYYQKASELGDVSASAQLAAYYEQGIGVPIDIEYALKLYQESPETWAKVNYQKLSKHRFCLENATTELFSVRIACTNRQILSKEIKNKQITVISENPADWSDTYFTGAIVEGTSQLEITYTREDYFASAHYTFIGRSDPDLITRIKETVKQKYGEPDTSEGEPMEGEASFQWLLEDGIKLVVQRKWPDTTTFLTYSLPKHIELLKAQQKQSPNKIDLAHNKVGNKTTKKVDPSFF
ncbi:Sel1 domain and tetratricopeptide repeat-containing protein [Psychromonas ingrahamii 37]|uniref:Sel1 domain and tetratricopeptide repeat-containing protein n=1 Tax=Psychromonas ingrahamii (strain DSM 17664 / CCUG 51855 / 37) TaxID=357804 RepID=A1STY0_PSYIN|nr:tetratricopeptide repeat protein [Psychromonas ingrahamii]ABM02945.1 Sel1 domain and tetratricopeptide repeat-containing protein [Psychromonas ingrahamii 37]